MTPLKKSEYISIMVWLKKTSKRKKLNNKRYLLIGNQNYFIKNEFFLIVFTNINGCF